MSTWFTSDQHFGHRNIIRYCDRPFADIEEMTRELVARHNAKVDPGDDVWHLGDFALDERQVYVVLPLLNGVHRLIAGNHDRCHPCHKKSEVAKRKYLMAGFASVTREVSLHGFLLNHMPYIEDERHATKYAEWRPKDEGAWLLHGHIHQLWKTRDKMINVGVDAWDYAPVHLSTLEKLRAYT